MYCIYDYATGNVHEFKTKEELILWWKKHNGVRNFDELNVTGADCHMTETEMFYDINSQAYVTTRTPLSPPVIKRYVILDEDGRHIDIRYWDDALWEVKKPCVSLKERYPELYSGKKRHRRRHKGAAFNHRDRRDYVSLDENDLPENFSIQNVIRSKPLSSITSWDCAEKRMTNKNTKPKCWKDQTKCNRQYARHKDRKKPSLEKLPEHNMSSSDNQLRLILQEVDHLDINGQIPA